MSESTAQAQGFENPRTAATLLGALAFGLTYTACILLHLPTPRYFPVERIWDLGPHANTISMGYYGNLLASALALLVVWGVARLPAASRALSRPVPARVLTWLTPSVFGVLLMVQFVHELHRWAGR